MEGAVAVGKEAIVDIMQLNTLEFQILRRSAEFLEGCVMPALCGK